MKKTLLFTILSMAIFWTSCSNDFEVAAPWKDIPIVYGLINLNDNVHYIRVEKAYLDPDGDAIELAQEVDSLYYENATVQFEVNDVLFNLEQVDGSEVGLPRDPGVFAHDPNILYKIDKTELGLVEGDVVKLIIDRNNPNLPLVTAETIVQGPGRLRIPDPTLATPPRLDFSSRLPEEIKWQSTEDARVFDVTVYLNYVEYADGNPANSVEKQIEWPWAKGFRVSSPETQYKAEKETAEFFDVLSKQIEVDPNMTRFFKDCEIKIVSGGEDFEKYVSVVQANSGITGSQEPPSYTNLSEGLGVFSSINIIYENNIFLSDATKDSLRVNILTEPLNFQ